MKERKWVLSERERERGRGGNAREREERGFNGLKKIIGKIILLTPYFEDLQKVPTKKIFITF